MDHCQLCYASMTFLHPSRIQTIWNDVEIQEIISKCNKYLSKDLIHPNTNWNLPICEECRESTKQLTQLDLKLEQLNKEIKQLIDQITTKILNERQKYQLLYTQAHSSFNSIRQTDVYEKRPVDNSFDGLNLPSANDIVYDDTLQDDTLSTSVENINESLPENDNTFKKEMKTDLPPRKDKIKKSNVNGIDERSGKVTSSDFQLKSDCGGFACPKCNKKFARLDILKRHKCGSTTFECETCGKSFSSQGSLQIHSRIHTGEKPHKCETCGKSFTLPHHLRLHLVIHTGEKPYQCDICKKSFREKNYLLTHKRQHITDENERKKYKCDICSKSFTLYTTLKYHLVRHSADSKYKCQICGKVCGRKRELKIHELIHSGEKKLLKCSHCSKSFSSEETLRVHEVMHTGRKDFQCDACGASYYSSGRLNRHKKLKHVDEGEFNCDACGKLYKTQIELNQHRRHHDKPVKSSGPSPKIFTCGVCDRSYTRERYLLDHQQVVHVVTTISSIVCDKCGKEFASNVDYNNHKMPHTAKNDSSRYKCQICNEIFRTRCAMICHFTGKHTESEFPFKCVCGNAFLGRKDLYHHKRNVCTVKRITTKIRKKFRRKKRSESEAEEFSEPNNSDVDDKKLYCEANSDLFVGNVRRSGRVRNRNTRINKEESESEDSEKFSDGERHDYFDNSGNESELEGHVEIKFDPEIKIKEEQPNYSD